VPDRQRILRHKLERIVGSFDFVLIDCPPSLGLLTLNALAVAREVLVPMQAHFLALQGVGKLLETVGLVCASVNPSLRVTGIELCMHDGQTTLAREVVADIEAFFADADDRALPWCGCAVLKPPIRRNVKLAEAPSFGQTIFDYAQWCAGANDYRKLAEGLLKTWDTPAQSVEAKPLETVTMREG
jgi:chromosome partitioning protein